MGEEYQGQLRDLSALSLEDTRVEIDITEQRLAEISAQLDAATAVLHATGEYADPTWFARARAAKRFIGAEHQRLLRHASELKKRLERSAAPLFVEIARQRLDKELFSDILRDATAQAAALAKST
jgi:hypothetical protein